MLSGDFMSAEKECGAVLQKHPKFPVAYHVLGQTLLRLNRTEDAIEAFRKAGEANANWSWGLAQGLAFAGRIDEARALARELEAREFPDAWALAEVYSAIGDLDRAVHWVEQGYEARRDWMPWIKANTFNEPLYNDKRFQEILRRLDLPQQPIEKS